MPTGVYIRTVTYGNQENATFRIFKNFPSGRILMVGISGFEIDKKDFCLKDKSEKHAFGDDPQITPHLCIKPR